MILKENFYWPDFITDRDIEIILKKQTASLRCALNHCNETDTVVQAGGSYGIWPKILSDKFNKVYTFEPDPVSFECLARNVGASSHVMKFQMALGDFNGEVFIARKRLTEHHVSKELNASYINKYKKQITSRILCIMVDSLNLSNCDALMVDVEGYEFLALKGAMNTIKKYKPLVLVQRDPTDYKIDTFLESLDYVFKENASSDRIYTHKGKMK